MQTIETTKESGTIVALGLATRAPECRLASGIIPTWSGRPMYELSIEDIEAVHDFCMEEAWMMGYEDAIMGEEERTNPFHRQFLNGVPYSVFMTYYTRGTLAAQRSNHQVVELFAKQVA